MALEAFESPMTEGAMLFAQKAVDVAERVPIFDRLRADFDAGIFGWVGDFRDFALGYSTFASTILARVPRWHARPVGSVVIGETSTGKTELINSLMRLFPEDHVIGVTSLSAKSLLYRCVDDAHCLHGKVVFVEELSGLRNEDLQYLLRILVTRGEVRHVTVISGRPVEIFVKGHISLQTTGLPTDRLRDDTMNRLVTIKSDASTAMTTMVIEQIKRRYAGAQQLTLIDQEPTLDFYRSFFEALQPRHVVVPFIDDIVFGGGDSEGRRLAKIAMDLLCTITLLNQDRRETDPVSGALVADRADLATLMMLTRSGLGEKSHALTTRERVVLEVIRKLADKGRFTYDQVMSLRPGLVSGINEGYSLTSVKYALDGLVEKGHVLSLGKAGRTRMFSMAGNVTA